MLSNFAVLVIVGIIWGLTNYLIEMNYKEDIPLKDNETQNMMTKAMMYIKNNYISFILFICNQSGSILFYFSLGTISLSLTVIVSNSVSFFTAILLETFHKKKQFSYSKMTKCYY